MSLCGLCVLLGIASMVFAIASPGADKSKAVFDQLVIALGPAAAVVYRRRVAFHQPIGILLRPITGLAAIGLICLLIELGRRVGGKVAATPTADLITSIQAGALMALIALAALTLTTSGRLFWLGGTRAPPLPAPRSLSGERYEQGI